MKVSLLAVAPALALSLCACAPTGGLSPAAQDDIANALATSCPILAAVGDKVASDSRSQAAYSLLASVCPPNPAPTSAAVAALDILNAYYLLKSAAK
jgi:hypothetical protein